MTLLDEAAQNPRNQFWIKHSLGVGNAAGKIAAAINEAAKNSAKTGAKVNQAIQTGVKTDVEPQSTWPELDKKLDVEKITLMGYLHDIGKGQGDFQVHPEKGYYYLKSLGYDDEYCEICLTHSFVNNDAYCMFSEFMQPERDKFVIDFIAKHQFTIEEKLVALCDMMHGTEMWTLDKRIIDVIIRHGTCAQTAERIRESYRLKQYFDELLGYNLYELFPEVKENL